MRAFDVSEMTDPTRSLICKRHLMKEVIMSRPPQRCVCSLPYSKVTRAATDVATISVFPCWCFIFSVSELSIEEMKDTVPPNKEDMDNNAEQ